MKQARLLCLPALALCFSNLLADNGPAPEAVSALGRLEPENGIIRVASPSTPQAAYGAVLSALRVEEGDLVEAGQVLATMDTAELDASLERARADVARAEESVAEARALIAQNLLDEAEVTGRLWGEWQPVQAYSSPSTGNSPASSKRSPAAASKEWRWVAGSWQRRHRSLPTSARRYSLRDVWGSWQMAQFCCAGW